MSFMVCESSDSQFVRTQSGPDGLDKTRLVMTFLIKLGSYRNIMHLQIIFFWGEGKTGKGKPELSRLEFSKKSSGNNFALSEVENNNEGPLELVCAIF